MNKRERVDHFIGRRDVGHDWEAERRLHLKAQRRAETLWDEEELDDDPAPSISLGQGSSHKLAVRYDD